LVIKKHIFTGLILFIMLVLGGGQALQADAVAFPQQDPALQIDSELWEAALDSPGRETTFLVSLRSEGGPELAIDAQFRLEQVLDLLGEKGGLREYQSFYGENIIKITGSLGLLRFLEEWPELASITLYQPGEAWELRADSTQDMSDLDATGQFSGKVTASNGTTALSGIRATAYRQTGPNNWSNVGNVLTNASGTYAISGLAEGIYRARFEDPAGSYVTEYFDDIATFNLATGFDVFEGSTTPNINAAMAQAGKISGTITKAAGGGAIADVVASAHINIGGTWLPFSSAVSNASGTYTIGGLPAGTSRVKFADSYVPKRYLDQWYNAVLTLEAAQSITVTAGATTPNINAAMGSYGSIKGNVKATDGVTNLAGIDVDAYRYNATYTDWEWYSFGETDASGNYEVAGLVTENYRLQFTDPAGQFASEFYNDKPDINTANNVAVTLGYATTNINAQLSLQPTSVALDLLSGWNLVSLPVTLADKTLPAAFSSIAGNYGDVFAYDACDSADPWKLFNPTLPSELVDLTSVNTTQGYWIKMAVPDTLTINGTYSLQTSIALCPGWNLVGYPSITPRPVGTALTGISGKYTLVWQYRASDSADPWKSFNPSLPPDMNDLKDMEPGYGYWIFMSQAATLTIPGR
jgi:hypothetical protein